MCIRDSPSIGRSLVLGMSTGLLWAPCAGPILGLILTGAALQGPSVHTTFLLLAFSAGAASSLAVALLAGNKVFAFMKKSLGAEEWIRRGLGAAVLVGVVAIAFGWDTGILTRLSLSSTSGFEQKLIDRFRPVAYACLLYTSEFRSVHADHNKAVILIFFPPGFHVRHRPQTIDARVGPKID